jgi:hypothetical protein
MELVARVGGHPLQVQTFPQSGKRATAGLVKGFSFPNDGFEPVRQKGANRTALFGSHHARFSKQVCVELECDVGLHDPKILARGYRAAQFLVLSFVLDTAPLPTLLSRHWFTYGLVESERLNGRKPGRSKLDGVAACRKTAKVVQDTGKLSLTSK